MRACRPQLPATAQEEEETNASKQGGGRLGDDDRACDRIRKGGGNADFINVELLIADTQGIKR